MCHRESNQLLVMLEGIVLELSCINLHIYTKGMDCHFFFSLLKSHLIYSTCIRKNEEDQSNSVIWVGLYLWEGRTAYRKRIQWSRPTCGTQCSPTPHPPGPGKVLHVDVSTQRKSFTGFSLCGCGQELASPCFAESSSDLPKHSSSLPKHRVNLAEIPPAGKCVWSCSFLNSDL